MRAELSTARWRKSTHSNATGGECLEVAEGFPGAARWRKSTHSGGGGGDCLEIAEGFLGAARWRKSTYSNPGGGDCLEVADNLPGIVPVRDSKNPHGPTLIFSANAWSVFVATIATKTDQTTY
ncbi:DUF397 domain-containing protein [Streptomyces sp. LZ34]